MSSSKVKLSDLYVSPRPPSLDRRIGSVGDASVEVRATRKWEQTAPGVRAAVVDEVLIALTAGDYCEGPAHLSIDELRLLRTLLDEALTVAEFFATSKINSGVGG